MADCMAWWVCCLVGISRVPSVLFQSCRSPLVYTSALAPSPTGHDLYCTLITLCNNYITLSLGGSETVKFVASMLILLREDTAPDQSVAKLFWLLNTSFLTLK